MKPLIYNDVLAAVAYVSGQENPENLARALLRDAELAHRHVRACRTAHPVFGDGSLMTAALRHRWRGDASFATAQGRAAWMAVLAAVQDRYGSPEAQLMQRVTVGSNSNRLDAIASPQSSQ